MTPSRRPPQRQCSSDTEQPVLIPDGGRKDPENEDWKWNPAVDEEPVIESAGEDTDPGEEGEQSPDEKRPNEEFPDHRHQPPSQRGDDESHSNQKRGETLSQTDEEPKQERASADGSQVSRRALLLGGAGVVGTAAIAGNWAVGSSGRTGAKAVAETYLTVIAANDWERAASVYHEDASPRRAIEQDNDTDSYESYLANNDRLELYEALDPTIDSITVLEHFPDLNGENAGQSFLAPDRSAGMDAWKLLAVILTIDTETVALGRRDDSYADALAGEETKEFMLVGTVSENGEWFLWDTSQL